MYSAPLNVSPSVVSLCFVIVTSVFNNLFLINIVPSSNVPGVDSSKVTIPLSSTLNLTSDDPVYPCGVVVSLIVYISPAVRFSTLCGSPAVVHVSINVPNASYISIVASDTSSPESSSTFDTNAYFFSFLGISILPLKG